MRHARFVVEDGTALEMCIDLDTPVRSIIPPFILYFDESIVFKLISAL
jgi:hypothetical protein